MHEKLPINYTRFTHHIVSYRCGAIIETTLHTLRDWPKAMQVWNYLNFPSHIHFYEDDLIIWLNSWWLRTSFSHLLLDDFEESFIDDNHSLWYILSQISTLFHSIMKMFGGSNKVSIPNLVSWQPRLENMVKSMLMVAQLAIWGKFGELLINWIVGFAGSCMFTSKI